MAYTVSLQTREIGIRMALGAQRNDVLRMILKKGLVLIVGGILAGVVLDLSMTRFMASQIWGVSATDPWTCAAVVVVILVVGVAACLLPAFRATRVDPLAALRSE
jgi:putative ABC transport system permease protein